MVTLKQGARRAIEPLARGLARLGVSPNTLTITGTLLTVVAALVIASGALVAGGVVLAVVSVADMLDGAVARVSGRVTAFGAFLDSTLDRYAEGALFLGLLYHYGRAGATHMQLAAGIVLLGSLMVSYTRARAEGLGLRCEVGVLARPERIVLLILGLLLSGSFPILLEVVLWGMAALTNFTAAQRLWHVRRLTTGAGRGA